MITITGLTHRQKSIMQLLWDCDTIERVRDLIKSLPTEQDRRDAESLLQIAIEESLEQQGELDKYLDQARDIVAKIQQL